MQDRHDTVGLQGMGAMNSVLPARERRLVRRLTQYWLEQCGEREFPCLDDIDRHAISDIWPSCFLLDTASNHNFPYFHYLGPSLGRYSGVLLSGKTDWTLTFLDKAVRKYREALAQRTPVLTEEELILCDGGTLLFRSVLLPLSDDQVTINFLLGAANGKVRHD